MILFSFFLRFFLAYLNCICGRFKLRDLNWQTSYIEAHRAVDDADGDDDTELIVAQCKTETGLLARLRRGGPRRVPAPRPMFYACYSEGPLIRTPQPCLFSLFFRFHFDETDFSSRNPIPTTQQEEPRNLGSNNSLLFCLLLRKLAPQLLPSLTLPMLTWTSYTYSGALNDWSSK